MFWAMGRQRPRPVAMPGLPVRYEMHFSTQNKGVARIGQANDGQSVLAVAEDWMGGIHLCLDQLDLAWQSFP